MLTEDAEQADRGCQGSWFEGEQCRVCRIGIETQSQGQEEVIGSSYHVNERLGCFGLAWRDS